MRKMCIRDRVKALHLNNETLEPLTRESLIYRDKCIASNDVENNSLHYAREFARADTIVIAAPYWDLSFPAIFRTYIERIMVSGITFQYESDGTVKGLCNARRIPVSYTHLRVSSGSPIIWNTTASSGRSK